MYIWTLKLAIYKKILYILKYLCTLNSIVFCGLRNTLIVYELKKN